MRKTSRGPCFFFFFCLSFLKPLKFVWCVPKWKFVLGKNREMGKSLPTFDCTLVTPLAGSVAYRQMHLPTASVACPPCQLMAALGLWKGFINLK